MRIASNEPRGIRLNPSSQSRERETGRIGSVIEDRGKTPYGNDSQGTSANTSYILNGSFQQNPQNNSFDYYIPSKPVINNAIIKTYQSNGEGRSRRTRQSIVNPINIYGSNPHHLLNKRG